jgi:hypothetical protein
MYSAPRVIVFGVWIAAWAFVLVQRGNAASITVNALDAYGRTFVDVVGTINLEDVETFQTKTANLHGIVVTLISYGGNPIAAIQMGDIIRANAMTTFVPGERVCTSACAIMWLAGAPRTVGNDAHIGFHAAYSTTTGQESGAANALIGAYLSKLGLSYKAIYFMTASGPNSVAWLTSMLANEWEVTYDSLHPPRALPVPTQPQLLPQAAQTQAAQTRAVIHTLLGAGLPMHAGLLLSPTILIVPENATVIIEDDCSHHVSWAPWCLVTYSGQRGYVNGIYLTLIPTPPPRLLPQQSPQPQPQPPSVVQPQPPKKLWAREYAGVATTDLMFRLAPDPKADPVQPEPIPVGTEVSLYADCEVWRGSGRGERDADNIWCPVIHCNQKGWANGFYLQMRDGRRMACIMYPTAYLCP